MFDKLFKSLASVYMIQELLKDAREESRRIQQEEYDEQHNSFERYKEDVAYGGHFETVDGKFDGDLVWIESKGPIPYILPRYVSAKKTKDNAFLITVDFSPAEDPVDEYKCMTSTEVDVAIKMCKEECENMGATEINVDKELA